MRDKLILDGTWELAGFDPGQSDWDEAVKPYPIPAEVPGEVHISLSAEGIIGDPLNDNDAEDCRWVSEKEWVYRNVFEIPEDFIHEQTFLEFEGLDTFATVLLNGRVVGTSRNMFVPQRFNISDMLVVDGENVVEVRFSPAAVMFSHARTCDCAECNHMPAISPRKMYPLEGYPTLIGAGIWRSARIVSYDTLSIKDIHIQTEVAPHGSEAWISIEIENHVNEDIDVLASLVVARGESREQMDIHEIVPAVGGTIEAVVRIEDPEFWWPNGMGDQPIYVAMVGLESEGRVLDVRDQHFALRTIQFVDSGGENNKFLVNGTPVEIKGAIWTPDNPFPSEMPTERLKDLMALAKATDFNFLRVWGGGIYEGPAFYRLCDDFGIMVWQDFMFSQTDYPETDGFADEVRQEVKKIVKRLRNNPSVVLWCGNSNCDAKCGKQLFTELIPGLVETLDGSRPYLPFVPCESKYTSLPDFERLRVRE